MDEFLVCFISRFELLSGYVFSLLPGNFLPQKHMCVLCFFIFCNMFFLQIPTGQMSNSPALSDAGGGGGGLLTV